MTDDYLGDTVLLNEKVIKIIRGSKRHGGTESDEAFHTHNYKY